MNIDEDTCEWLGCPTPLDMYKHQCALLEDELITTQQLLRKARANVTGLVQMNDLLSQGKAHAERLLQQALEEIDELEQRGSSSGVLGFNIVAEQRDYLFRENQRLMSELASRSESSA